MTVSTGIGFSSTRSWEICEHCTRRFLARKDNEYCSPPCRAAAGRGKLHPNKLTMLLADMHRLPKVSKDAREFTQLWAWRRLVELRALLASAPMADQVLALNSALDALLEATGFAE